MRTPIQRKVVTCLFFLTLFFCRLAWSQANVDESQETVTIYVDSAKGSDSNPGTKQLPLKTVTAGTAVAISNNQAGIGTKVIINPGTYRESISMRGQQKDTTLPITFQAKTTGKTIISGADVWTGWKVYAKNSSIYTKGWSNKWGLCAANDDGVTAGEEDIIRRREMIIVNGKPLTQVMTLGAMRQSTFYVNESNATVYIWPANGTNINTSTVEVAARSSLFSIYSKANMVLRGLTFQYANSCRSSSAVSITGTSHNVLLDQDTFNWNNAAGLELITTKNTTVQNSFANHNGFAGMTGLKTTYDLWQSDQTRYNGWRGAQGVYYNWGVGGFHWMRGHNQTIKDSDASYNQTFGFKLDTDHEDVVVDSFVASENLLAGGFSENNQGPVTISNSYFCSGDPYTGPNNPGFEMRNSSYITFTGNTVLNNENGILVIGDAGGFPSDNWETGEQYTLFNQNLTMTNNIIDGSTDQLLFSIATLGGSDWTKFQSTLTSDYNTWWNATDPQMYYVPVPEAWTKVDFAGWKAVSTEEANSSWKSPVDPGAGCKVTADMADFWLVMNALVGYQTVSQGGTAIWTPNVVPLAFSGTVTLDSDGIKSIPGATATWSPKTLTNSGTATFTVTTTGSTPKGSYPITLIATSGSITRTATVSVVVQ